jgi:hypothetical protein
MKIFNNSRIIIHLQYQQNEKSKYVMKLLNNNKIILSYIDNRLFEFIC